MRIPTRQRLSYRQARNTLCVAFLLGIIFSLFVITANYYRIQSKVEEQIQSLASITISPASRIAYNIDIELAKELVKGLAQLPLVKQAAIIEPSGDILASSYRETPESKYSQLIGLLFNKSPEYSFKLSVAHDPTEELGNLHLTINMEPTGERFINDSLTLLGTVLVQACILAFSLLVMFYFMLTKPLSSITSQLSNIHASEDPTKLRIDQLKQHQQDEIGLLIETTNKQLSEIERSFHELKQAEKDRQRYTERLEQAVELRTKELTEANDELTSANQMLEVARKDAERSSQARAIFLANMSHEIRTPLSGVLGMINLALESKTGIDDATRDQLKLASASGDTLQQILNDILDIAKVESGKINLEAMQFDLREMLEQTVTLFKNSPQAEKIDMYLSIQPDFPGKVTGDPTRIRQIISNLISNALKFTNKGHVAIIAEYLPTSGSTAHGHATTSHNIRLKIIDTGIGMTPEEQDVIFTPFTQATSHTTRKYGGTGLGLTLVKQLTECMHGDITIESEKGVGSCFTLSFHLPCEAWIEQQFLVNQPDLYLINTQNNHPIENQDLIDQLKFWGGNLKFADSSDAVDIAENQIYLAFSEKNESHQSLPENKTIIIVDEVSPESRYLQLQRPIFHSLLKDALKKALNIKANKQEASSNADAPTHSYNKERILIVEDNEVNQKVATGLLKKLGFTEIHIADNGQIAVDLLKKENSFDLILMDCHMPVMDGYEATQAIRDLPQGKNIPIIAVTANIMNEDKQRCFDCGMNDFLTKPYRKEDLIRKLDQWLLDPEQSASV
ncbi:ATP-binding protein [Litoribrevibacter albus]|uniref:histidine kinase n=1 Tax=Litoribrevibacter albus TaxID=1473156 RepID=A0AA37S6S8_9GAMM|nr:ATP-binding protein [Litoribrevibacter albus]GLQ30112.1 hybrid sensor histidine kinase/response regulator [Litoribrevibacter albus]